MPDGASPLPDLTFPGVEHGNNETTWDLSFLLYRGGSAAYTKHVARMMADGVLGAPDLSRLGLVTRIHDVINGKLVGGGSAYTAQNTIRWMRRLFAWADGSGHRLDLASIESTFLAWTDSLVTRCQVKKDLSHRSAYTMGAQAAEILDEVLERPTRLIFATRLQAPPQRKTARGVKSEKQNLEETFAFGHFLQDICDVLTADTVLKGPLPVRIPLRLGGALVEWSGHANWRAVQHHLDNAPERSNKGRKRRNHRKSLANFRAREAEGTLRTRYPLANKRCEAELLMFIGQTGMNLAQAHKLKLRHFYYASHIDGYLVRERKGRRGGDVLFEIFKEYRPHFERYLDWRRTLFPDSDVLFPFVRKGGRPLGRHPQFSLRKACKNLKLRFVPPQALRNTRVNWLLRRSGDPDLTAEMAQHAKETLQGTYERPSQQRAMAEITRFWAKHDPTIARTSPPAPGECDGKPVPLFASTLLSDSSLQFQLKHASRLMPLYYGRGYTKLHMNEDVESALVEAMYEAMARKLQVAIGDRFVSPLGVQRKEVVLINMVAGKDAKQLASAGRRGQVYFRETRVGACVHRLCGYGGIESVSPCTGGDGRGPCAEALYDRDKAPEIERDLARIKEELAVLPAGSPRHSALLAERQGMENYLNVVRA